ncbi:MAG TPA: GNAT family N-acetyltransferase [Chloroflexia bacterium]|nr:GNAT family N-acetyltransferase [Chloroflexia bacterium]
MLAAAFAEYAASYTPAALTATTPPAPRICERMEEGPIWVAVTGGRVVGTLGAVLRGPQLYLRGMAVLPGVRGHGVGAALLRVGEAYARAHGAECLRLSTTPFLAGAIRLYQAAGFEWSPEGPADLAGTPLRTMIKRLRPHGGGPGAADGRYGP